MGGAKVNSKWKEVKMEMFKRNSNRNATKHNIKDMCVNAEKAATLVLTKKKSPYWLFVKFMLLFMTCEWYPGLQGETQHILDISV